MASVGALVGVWSLVAASRPAVILPSPAETGAALASLVRGGDLLPELGRTSGRAAIGAVIAVIVGTVAGFGTALSPTIDGLLRPLRALMIGLPPIVVVVVATVWLGTDWRIAIIVAVLVTLPELMVAAAEAVRSVDSDLVEMAHSFALPRSWIARHVLTPAVASPLLAVGAITLAGSLRLTLMAELLSASDGIGASVAAARTNLDTPAVFAWTAVAISFALAVELVVLGPVRRRAMAPRTDRSGGFGRSR